jgi:hypothetical protein
MIDILMMNNVESNVGNVRDNEDDQIIKNISVKGY